MECRAPSWSLCWADGTSTCDWKDLCWSCSPFHRCHRGKTCPQGEPQHVVGSPTSSREASSCHKECRSTSRPSSRSRRSPSAPPPPCLSKCHCGEVPTAGLGIR